MSSGKDKSGGFAVVKVDISKASFFDFKALEYEQTHKKPMRTPLEMYAYQFENLATSVREFKALKCCEFFRMAPIIFKPSLSILHKSEMLLNHQKLLSDAHCLPIRVGSVYKGVLPLQHAKNIAHVDDIQTKMRKYAVRNKKLYNPSQLLVLDKVIDMPESDILLIQGPPGTGKTHTITGILSMLFQTNEIKRVMVCAPSNAAIDEIIHRISLRGFVGKPENPDDVNSVLHESFSVDGMLLRIGAMEYEPSPEVKRHTLDERLVEALNGKKTSELK